jgi:hypothetical protein
MKKLPVIIIAMLIIGFTFSCKKDDSTQSKVLIIVKSTFAKSSLTKNDLNGSNPVAKTLTYGSSTITVDTFLINIKNIDIELDDLCNDDCNDDCNDGKYDMDNDDKGGDDCDVTLDDDIEITGPFLIDLLSPEAVNGFPVASMELPNASYDEIEFTLNRYKLDNPKAMYDRSIYIAGEINGKRMRMWYTGEYDFKIEFPDSSDHYILTGDDLKMYLDFHIDNMLTSLNNVDFSSAADRNGNDIIEIGSDDGDGNRILAHHIIEAVLESCDLDDQFDDD